MCDCLGAGEKTKKQLLNQHLPAPSFNQLTSTGCRSVNEVLSARFYDAFADNSLFSRISSDAVKARRLQLRVSMLLEKGKQTERQLSLAARVGFLQPSLQGWRLFADILPSMPLDIDAEFGGAVDSSLASELSSGENFAASLRLV